MKKLISNLENNWKEKSLESLEKNIWPSLASDEGSYLIKTCHSLRKKPLKNFNTEDLRIMISQEIGLYYLIPLAIETLTKNLFAEGDMFKGDLLKNVLEINPEFWRENKSLWSQINDLIKEHRDAIKKMKFDTSKFDDLQKN